MTPEVGLELARLRFEILALRLLLRTLYASAANNVPNGPQSLRASFADLRKSHQEITAKGVDPAISDMMAGEWQEILDDLLAFVEAGLSPKNDGKRVSAALYASRADDTDIGLQRKRARDHAANDHSRSGADQGT